MSKLVRGIVAAAMVTAGLGLTAAPAHADHTDPISCITNRGLWVPSPSNPPHGGRCIHP